MKNILLGLQNNAEKLKNTIDSAAGAARKRALDAIREIEEAIKGLGL